jgi:hypothetical protein
VYAGTELEVGCACGVKELVESRSDEELGGGGSAPPERKEGHRERSSGREVPVEEEGER